MIPILIFYLLITSALAQEDNLLILNLDVYKNDTVILKDLDLSFGSPSKTSRPEGDYSLKILDKKGNILYQKNIQLSFYVLTDPPMETDHVIIYRKIEYEPSMRKIELSKRGTIIFEKKINFCNNNNICEPSIGENEDNCAIDCKKESILKELPWKNLIVGLFFLFILFIFLVILRKRKKNDWKKLEKKWE